MTTGSQYRGHHIYTFGAKTYDPLTYGGTSYAGKYVGGDTLVERSVSRTGGTDKNTFQIRYGQAPLMRDGNYLWIKTQDPFGFSAGTAADYASTTLQIMANPGAAYHSVRIYKTVLTDAQVAQNHLADLCAAYGVDVSSVLAMNAEKFAALVEGAKSIALPSAKGTAEYNANKTALENVIKRYGPPIALDDEKRAMSDYDELYIGADGSKSANGGGLIGLFSAFAGATDSVDLDLGVWYNKVAQVDASLNGGTYSASLTSGWKLRQNGGFGYDLEIIGTAGHAHYLKAQDCGNVMVLDKEMLASPDFTVEYSAIYELYYMNGEKYNEAKTVIDYEPTERFGYFGNLTSRAGSIGTSQAKIDETPEGIRQVRWYVGFPDENWSEVYARVQAHIDAAGTGGNAYASGQDLWKDYSRMIPKVYMQTVTRDENADGSKAAYTAYSDVQKKAGNTWTTDAGEGSYFYYPKSDTNYVFQLFNRVPVTVYSLRVYDAVLTEAEMNHNRFIDLAAFYGTDLADYSALTNEVRIIVDTAMSGAGFEMGKEAFETLLNQIIGEMNFEFDMSDTLYVTKGLTVLLAAYGNMNTDSYKAADNQLLWYNGVTEGTYATLLGTGWAANPNGGFTIVKTLADDCHKWNASTSLYRYKESYGVELQASMLPEGSYTVEYIANPVGVTDADGNRAVLELKPGGATDLYSENSTAIGPLRNIQFDGIRPGGGTPLFTRRWLYGTGDTPWIDAWSGNSPIGKPANGAVGNLPGYTAADISWDGIGLSEIVSTTITLDVGTGDHTYTFYHNNNKLGSSYIPAKSVISAHTDPRFRLMGNIAGTIYSVRVYDRVLSEAERAQNHFADLVYFYDIDISAIRGAMATMTDLYPITKTFVDMGFDMTKEEAQAYFDGRMVQIWLSYNGFGVRKDLSDGMRFYFGISESGILAMLGAGASIEIGAVVNVGKSALPVLDDYAYDYKLVAFDSIMGKADALFVDEDTFAVTVRYNNAGRENMLKDILCQGYVKLTMEGGTTLTYYLNTTEEAPEDIFDGYNRIIDATLDEVENDAELKSFIEKRIENCYTNLLVHLDASAAEGGNGSAETPYKFFEDAFASVKEGMKGMSAPTHVSIVAKDGTYSVSEAQIFTGEDKTYPYSDLTIKSENGGAVLTTAVNMSGSFTSEGGNIYSYQFEKDAEGNYPAFRYLLVDGKRADIAYNGSKYPVYETATLLGYDRPFEGVWQTAIDQAMAGTLTMTSALPANYQGREDLAAMYDYYRPRAIAYAEVLKLYNGLDHNSKYYSNSNGSLLNATASSSTDAGYTETFAYYQAMYLGRYRAECEARLRGPRASTYRPSYTYIKEADIQTFDDRVTYAYQQARHHIYWSAVNAYLDVIYTWEITLAKKTGWDGKTLQKWYLAESLLGEEVLNEVKAAGVANYKTALKDSELEVDFSFQYMKNILDIDGIDLDDFVIDKNGEKHYACYLEGYNSIQIPAGGNGTFDMSDHLVHVSGHKSYLDKDNEFYYDEANGTLYYYSTSGVAGKTFSRPTSDYLLKFYGAEGFAIEGITFTGVDDYFMTVNGHRGTLGGGNYNEAKDNPFAGSFPRRSAIFMEDVSNVTVTGCHFREIGCEAITARGWLTDITVEGNTFENIGSAGVRFGENIREVEMEPWQDGIEGNKNITVQDNYFKNISTDYFAAAIQLTTAYNCRVLNNTVSDCAYVGISVGWQWAYSTVRSGVVRNVENTEIAYNFVTGFMQESHDGGAIYVAGPNTMPDDTRIFNAVHDNYVLYNDKTGDGQGSFDAGLYFDGASSSYHVYNNVIVTPAYGAAEGETDYEKYGITEATAKRLAAARDGATFIYLQHITNQVVNNIVLENNIILNVRATKVDDQRKEVYKTYLKNAAGKNVTDNNSTVYINGWSNLRDAARIIMAAGAIDHLGNMDDIVDNVY